MRRCVRLSPPGLGAVSIWRLTDTQARWPGQLVRATGKAVPWPLPQQVRHGLWTGSAGPIDEILAVAGEGWLEVHVHGGEGVQLALESFLGEQGWVLEGDSPRQGAPGGLRAARALASARWGALARLDEEIRQVMAEHGPLDPGRTQDLISRLERSLALADHGRRLAAPALVRLVGQPNAGKSTLFNALLSDRRALVSPHPGTTRDSVRAGLSVAGVPMTLEDTAGFDGPPQRETCFREPIPDLVVHLLRRSDEPRLSGPAVLVVLGRCDEQEPGDLPAVSGLTGRGVLDLLGAVGLALGVHEDPLVDEYAPLDPDLLARMGRARAQLLTR